MATTAVAEQFAEPALVALGVAVALYGLLLMSNLGRFTEAKCRATANSRWTAPALASVPLQRLMGAFAVVVGILFVVKAVRTPV